MFKYNKKTNRFEFVSAEEYEKELLNNSLERELKKAIDPDEPIRIEFKMEDSFEVKQSDFDEDKSKKDRCVEESMARIDEILSGKHFRAIRGAIEQQIRRAYKQGYCDGIDDAPGEDDAYEKGFRDGVTYCKGTVWKISADKGMETMKMEDSI